MNKFSVSVILGASLLLSSSASFAMSDSDLITSLPVGTTLEFPASQIDIPANSFWTLLLGSSASDGCYIQFQAVATERVLNEKLNLQITEVSQGDENCDQDEDNCLAVVNFSIISSNANIQSFTCRNYSDSNTPMNIGAFKQYVAAAGATLSIPTPAEF